MNKNLFLSSYVFYYYVKDYFKIGKFRNIFQLVLLFLLENYFSKTCNIVYNVKHCQFKLANINELFHTTIHQLKK